MPDERYTIREEVLDLAKSYTTKQRNVSYGEPDADFTRIAAVLNALGFRRNDEPITGADVAGIQIAVKMSRLTWNPTHKDSWVDIAGYAACGLETALMRAADNDAIADVVDIAMGRAMLRPFTDEELHDESSCCDSDARNLGIHAVGCAVGAVINEAAATSGLTTEPPTYEDLGLRLIDTPKGERLVRDLDTIKSVDEKFRVKPRPIRDNPQA